MLQGIFRSIFAVIILFPLLSSAQTLSFSSSLSGDWDDDYDVWDWYSSSKPFIEFNYGIGNLKHKDFSGAFGKIGQGELRLGFSEQDFMFEKTILELRDKYLLISYYSFDLQGQKAAANELRAQMSRFGFAMRHGYGYHAGLFTFVPFNSHGYIWSRLDMKDMPSALNAADNKIIERYNKSFRFGDITEGGLRISVGPMIAIQGSYEASIVFPRHVFWPWAGSAVIREAGNGMIDWFVDEIFDSTPGAAPIVDFLLKNGWNYAFYSFERDKMNFPFNSEKPLSFETVKFGLTFSF